MIWNILLKGGLHCHPLNRKCGVSGGVSDIGFSSRTVPTYYSVSEYFVQESGSAEIYFRGPEIRKQSVALIREERRVEIKARVFPEA